LHDVAQGGPNGRVRRQVIHRHVELHRRADDPLQQRVMKFLRNSHALGEPFFEPQIHRLRRVV